MTCQSFGVTPPVFIANKCDLVAAYIAVYSLTCGPFELGSLTFTQLFAKVQAS